MHKGIRGNDKALRRRERHLSKASDVINAHAIVGVQHGDLAARADVEPVLEVVHGLEGEGVQYQQWQRKVIDLCNHTWQSASTHCDVMLLPISSINADSAPVLDIAKTETMLNLVHHGSSQRDWSTEVLDAACNAMQCWDAPSSLAAPG